MSFFQLYSEQFRDNLLVGSFLKSYFLVFLILSCGLWLAGAICAGRWRIRALLAPLCLAAGLASPVYTRNWFGAAELVAVFALGMGTGVLVLKRFRWGTGFIEVCSIGVNAAAGTAIFHAFYLSAFSRVTPRAFLGVFTTVAGLAGDLTRLRTVSRDIVTRLLVGTTGLLITVILSFLPLLYLNYIVARYMGEASSRIWLETTFGLTFGAYVPLLECAVPFAHARKESSAPSSPPGKSP